MPVTACVTKKQLDLKHHKFTHILNQVLFFLIWSNLASWHKHICWHKTISKVNLIWRLVCKASNSHFSHLIIKMYITSIINVRKMSGLHGNLVDLTACPSGPASREYSGISYLISIIIAISIILLLTYREMNINYQ